MRRRLWLRLRSYSRSPATAVAMAQADLTLQQAAAQAQEERGTWANVAIVTTGVIAAAGAIVGRWSPEERAARDHGHCRGWPGMWVG